MESMLKGSVLLLLSLWTPQMSEAQSNVAYRCDKSVYIYDAAGHWVPNSIGGDSGGLRRDFFQGHDWAWGRLSHTVDEPLQDDTVYTVRLGFAETYEPNCATGKRVFNVTVNGELVVSELDVFEKVGCNNALVLDKKIHLRGSNKIEIELAADVNNPMISLIQVKETNCDRTCPCFDESIFERNLETVTMGDYGAGTSRGTVFATFENYAKRTLEHNADRLAPCYDKGFDIGLLTVGKRDSGEFSSQSCFAEGNDWGTPITEIEHGLCEELLVKLGDSMCFIQDLDPCPFDNPDFYFHNF